MNEHEAAFVQSFIVPRKRARYLELLSSPKRRRKILERLNHSLDLDWDFATPDDSATPEMLEASLKKKGARASCYIVAACTPLDGAILPLTKGVEVAFLHPFGIVLSCIPGKLAYYKPESPESGAVLCKC